MATNVLITGGSGYLGGSFLDLLSKDHALPNCGTIYSLVRSEDQAKQSEASYRCTAAFLDVSNEAETTSFLLEKKISVVFFLIEALNSHKQLILINALGVVGEKLGLRTHFLHTTGAKMFSGFADHPTDRVISDTDDDISTLQAQARPKLAVAGKATQTNTAILQACKLKGLRCYIFAPCIVYGESTGFGNKISIQTVAVVRAAKALRQVCKVDNVDGTWPVCHVNDNSTLYAQILRKILAGDENLGYNDNGYYLASSGSVRWLDIYTSFAAALKKRDVVDTADVGEVAEESLHRAAQALDCPEEMVPFSMGGKCTYQADHGKEIGWSPKYPPRHLIETAQEEVELILRNLK